MFIPNLPGDCLNMIYKGAPPGFCFVELKLPAGAVPPGHKALQGLCRDGRVSSALFRQKVFKVFKDAVEKERRATGTQLKKTLRFACPLSVFLLSLFCLSTFCLFIVIVSVATAPSDTLLPGTAPLSRVLKRMVIPLPVTAQLSHVLKRMVIPLPVTALLFRVLRWMTIFFLFLSQHRYFLS